MADVIEMKKPKRLIRWPEVERRTGLSKTQWWRGMSLGIYPKAIKLAPPPSRAVGWLESDIDALIERLAAAQEG